MGECFSWVVLDQRPLNGCVCVCVCVRARARVCVCVIFAHKPRLLDVAAQLKRSAHAALGLAINCAIVVGQRTHGITFRALRLASQVAALGAECAIYGCPTSVCVCVCVCRHLARNPFICDCNLRWLSEYLQSHPIETSGARCDSPRRMQRKKIGLVKNDKFRCKGTFTSSLA